ncbi:MULTISPECIES: LolA family protein [Anaerotignum]|uniref:LolA family protein n=1 Tax=Anaerotignum TaxID=2039240 RepID=UPI00210E60EF|nr:MULTISPECIES: outer-membrane lipoprotein carrier protein LolA [Anaerotignum]MCQ4936249.1 outer-membrane lipoprotein carrier protein LolA [Anaerotignum propionicum]
MKKAVAVCLSLLLLFSLGGCKKEEPLSELETIQKQLNEMDGYYCTASLTRISNKGETTYGTKQYAKSTGEYRLELTSPENVAGNYTIFDGQKICQYNPRLNNQLVRDVPASQHRNELFLGQFIKNYMKSEGVGVEAAALDESKCIVMEAVIPGTDGALSSEKLWVDRETYLPKRLVLYDNQGQERYRLDYDEFVYNPDFEENLFQIKE